MRRKRQLLLIGHVVRFTRSKNPPIALTTAVEGKKIRGRPLRMISDTLSDNIESILHNVSKNVCVRMHWTHEGLIRMDAPCKEEEEA